MFLSTLQPPAREANGTHRSSKGECGHNAPPGAPPECEATTVADRKPPNPNTYGTNQKPCSRRTKRVRRTLDEGREEAHRKNMK